MPPRQFDEFVFPYDKMVNDAIHKIGGMYRSHCHCHGHCMQYLERMSEMGVDATEPLEPPHFGDVDLAEAKRRVGDRMLLSGNILSQDFIRASRDEVKNRVRQAISAAARGGGFTLRTTGGHVGVNPDIDRDMLRKVIENVEAMMEAAIEYGTYPIHA
jgi:uroporphyrinogen-III decarboxylase